ncbi:MAG: outer membrane lipoprotein chaperone LolA [Pseudomonadota bacterium]
MHGPRRWQSPWQAAALFVLWAVTCGPAIGQEDAEALSAATVASEPVSARSVLESFVSGLDRFSADFEQVVLSVDGAVMEEGQGDIWLQTPDLFRWAYHGDFPELIIADGTTVWMYDEALEQVTVRDQQELSGDSPLLVIMDLERLDERFEVTELGTVTGLHLLELTSRSVEAQFERLVLGFQDGTLSRLVLEDAFGMRTELAFTAVVRNPDVPEGHFAFVPPEGVDVVGDLPPGAAPLQY